MKQEAHSFFFGLQAACPWPDPLPHGRCLQENDRHATLVFLGKIDPQPLFPHLAEFPAPPFKAGLAGIFDRYLFLPEHHPRVVCWHVDFSEALKALEEYQKHLMAWLKKLDIFKESHLDEREWLPHVTIARSPFDCKAWAESFRPLPVIFTKIHLYESIGNLRYVPVWTLPLVAPWDEIEHTADMAMIVRGETLPQLYRHAQMALAFKFPEILSFLPASTPSSLDDIIMLLNEAIAHADQKIGCPFKAVSFHGKIEIRDQTLCWEMIIDV